MVLDRIGQEIKVDSTIIFFGDRQVYNVEGLSPQKVRIRIRHGRLSTIWPENCVVIDENLSLMAYNELIPSIWDSYMAKRKELING